MDFINGLCGLLHHAPIVGPSCRRVGRNVFLTNPITFPFLQHFETKIPNALYLAAGLLLLLRIQENEKMRDFVFLGLLLAAGPMNECLAQGINPKDAGAPQDLWAWLSLFYFEELCPAILKGNCKE